MSAEAIRNLQDMTEEFRKNPGDKEIWGALSDALEEAEVKGVFLAVKEWQGNGWIREKNIRAFSRLDKALINTEERKDKLSEDERIQIIYLPLDEDGEDLEVPIITAQVEEFVRRDGKKFTRENRMHYVLSKEWIWEVQV